MKVKDIKMLLSALDDDIEVEFIDIYDVGIEVMSKGEEDFYYCEMEE